MDVVLWILSICCLPAHAIFLYGLRWFDRGESLHPAATGALLPPRPDCSLRRPVSAPPRPFSAPPRPFSAPLRSVSAPQLSRSERIYLL